MTITITDSTKSRYVDFITELPIEPLPFIMDHFSLTELFEFFMVSKTWKIRLLGCYSLWSNITISMSTPSKMITHKNILVAITWQMVQLRLLGHYRLYFHILPAVKNTLRYLKLISVSAGFGILLFEDVLEQCPKLEGFWFDTHSVRFRSTTTT
ncbi:hypothetical protein BDC45DRAFT_570777 [Circinella umbellata]|nr:hypothetical protein BDC45DRAFT_570777 [Circinella umbellata]